MDEQHKRMREFLVSRGVSPEHLEGFDQLASRPPETLEERLAILEYRHSLLEGALLHGSQRERVLMSYGFGVNEERNYWRFYSAVEGLDDPEAVWAAWQAHFPTRDADFLLTLAAAMWLDTNASFPLRLIKAAASRVQFDEPMLSSDHEPGSGGVSAPNGGSEERLGKN